MSFTLFQNFFHITHVCNVPSIMKDGLLSHNLVVQRGISYKDISNAGVQQKRSCRRVHGRGLHDYVPMFANPLTPMLYSLRGKFENLVILSITGDMLHYNKHHFF